MCVAFFSVSTTYPMTGSSHSVVATPQTAYKYTSCTSEDTGPINFENASHEVDYNDIFEANPP